MNGEGRSRPAAGQIAEAHLVADSAVLVLRVQPLAVPAAAIVLQAILDLMLVEGNAAAGAGWDICSCLTVLQDTACQCFRSTANGSTAASALQEGLNRAACGGSPTPFPLSACTGQCSSQCRLGRLRQPSHPARSHKPLLSGNCLIELGHSGCRIGLCTAPTAAEAPFDNSTANGSIAIKKASAWLQVDGTSCACRRQCRRCCGQYQLQLLAVLQDASSPFARRPGTEACGNASWALQGNARADMEGKIMHSAGPAGGIKFPSVPLYSPNMGFSPRPLCSGRTQLKPLHNGRVLVEANAQGMVLH